MYVEIALCLSCLANFILAKMLIAKASNNDALLREDLILRMIRSNFHAEVNSIIVSRDPTSLDVFDDGYVWANRLVNIGIVWVRLGGEWNKRLIKGY